MATRTNKEEKMTPIVLEITLETPEEVGKLFALFNYTPILDYFNWKREGKEMRGTLSELYLQATGETYIPYFSWWRKLEFIFNGG